MAWNVAAASIGSTFGAAMSGGAINLDLDRTVLLQMLLFGGLIVLLKPLLFDPVLKVFEERERRTEGAREEARRLQERAGELLRQYEREMERVQQAANEERDKLRAETTRLEAQILSEAREATSKIVEDGRAGIARELTAMQSKLHDQASDMAGALASRVLGHEVPR